MGCSKTPELLSYIGAGLSTHLEKLGFQEMQASEAALDFMEWLRHELGGQLIYFPKGAKKDHDDRAAEVYDKHFRGATVGELVQEYKLSAARVYRLLAQERLRRRLERDAEAEARRKTDAARWKREGGIGDDL